MSATALPGRASDAGPEDPIDTRDASDWLYVAQQTIQAVPLIADRDPAMQQWRQRHAIDQAIDALKCARELT
jgi:hypothetical protein